MEETDTGWGCVYCPDPSTVYCNRSEPEEGEEEHYAGQQAATPTQAEEPIEPWDG